MTDLQRDADLFLLRLELAKHLDAIKRLMPPSYRVTLVLRSPALQAQGKDADVVIGDDDLVEAAAAIARAATRPPPGLPGPSGG